MKWNKLGLVYKVDHSIATRAMVPTPILIDDKTIRVLFTLCDHDNVGRPFYVDVDASDPTKIINRSSEPVMSDATGPDFDEHGIVPASLVTLDDGRLLMYYSGFERGQKVRYRIFTGAAVSENGGTSFERVSRTPILDRSDAELMFRCAPFVIRDGETFRMWYVAGSTWEIVNGKEVPRYVLKYAESQDGLIWPSEGFLSMDLENDEHGFGRPWVVKTTTGYELFYSIRRRSLASYRLGYAESTDGLNWRRLDDRIGLEVTPDSFDSHGMSYTAPITVKGRTFCFYNGNNFGANGFAVAELIS